jgi:PAS domain S-box-containing protein
LGPQTRSPETRSPWTGGSLAQSLRAQSFSLVLIAAALAAVLVIVGLFRYHEVENQITQIRQHGVRLSALLAEVPMEQLVATKGSRGMLELAAHGQNDPNLAYAAVVAPDGRVLRAVTSEGVIVPGADVPSEPAFWHGERELTLAGSEIPITEFHAPVIVDGELAALVRVGYYAPSLGLDAEQVSLFAAFALPVFLLVPTVLFLLRRELKPITRVIDHMDNVLATHKLGSVALEPGPELRPFLKQFNRFIDSVSERIDDLADRERLLQTSVSVLQYRQNRLVSILEALPQAVVVVDETGTAILANDRVSSILGLQVENVIGHAVEEWCPFDEARAFLLKHKSSTSSRLASEALEFQPESHSGKQIEVRVLPFPATEDHEREIGQLIVFSDVTTEALARESRADFVGHLAHELKTPLNVLGMYSESLHGEAGEDRDYQVEAANVIHDEVERLADLINNLLSITKIEMGSLGLERRRVRVGEFLSDAFEAVQHSDTEDLAFELDIPRDMSALLIDKDLMRVAINNLLTNAVKYNRPGGKVTLRAEETDDAVLIQVSDTGIGISNTDKEHIFDKFFRSEDDAVRRRSGHGLGLALAREIVQLHHGTLDVESDVGEGTTFTLRLGKDVSLLRQGA